MRSQLPMLIDSTIIEQEVSRRSRRAGIRKIANQDRKRRDRPSKLDILSRATCGLMEEIQLQLIVRYTGMPMGQVKMLDLDKQYRLYNVALKASAPARAIEKLRIDILETLEFSFIGGFLKWLSEKLKG